MGNLVPIYINPIDLDRVKNLLISIGYKEIIILQDDHEGQVYGLGKDITAVDLDRFNLDQKTKQEFPYSQSHIRLLKDGKIEAEIELHRFDLRHITSPRVSDHNGLAMILSREGIHYHYGSATGPIDAIESLLEFPKEGELNWVLFIVVIGIGVGLAYFASKYLSNS